MIWCHYGYDIVLALLGCFIFPSWGWWVYQCIMMDTKKKLLKNKVLTLNGHKMKRLEKPGALLEGDLKPWK
ncbi:hypothetical protein QVD17_31444 [Tagetes erecta]|uniref:Uncharacterized protein n=1 Tax=Tagetes erecta TaxID=13708 RepID=A0AAD8K3E2_TARER|nr:hypothetical protein QVD17_31444 [Tagetes erecta]